jgi:hypothetical protein
MDPRLQALIDRAEILEVLHQYVHACDRSDHARIVDVYHPDSLDNHGTYQCSGREFAKIVCDGNAERETMSHLLGQSTIRVDGDHAGAETYFIATVTRSENGERHLDQMGGRYVDTLERRDGRWRIKDRICTCEWSVTSRIEKQWHQDGQFVRGTFDHNDPSYHVLGLR